MELEWRQGRGEIAVQAHVESIMNGQETEPFETQALDTVSDILHAVAVNWDGEGEFDAETFLNSALRHFNHESGN